MYMLIVHYIYNQNNKLIIPNFALNCWICLYYYLSDLILSYLFKVKNKNINKNHTEVSKIETIKHFATKTKPH